MLFRSLSFLGDAEAMRFTQRIADLRACRRHIAGHACQRQKLGYGPWTVRTKADGRTIGFGGLYDDPFDPGWGVEVGYFFTPAAWGKGFASELTSYCVGVAQQQARWPTLSAFAHPDNVASQNVLAKCGFRQERFVPEMERWLYRRDLCD